MRIKINEIAYYLPKQTLTNEDLHKENPLWDMAHVEARVGVLKRHIAEKNETALDMALNACEELFSLNKGVKKKIDCIIFCTQSEDYIMPPNSCILHKKLGLSDNVFAFDFNLACSGYVYGLAITQGLICSGIAKNVLLVTSETYSKYIHPKDRSARVLFGDAAAVSWVTASDAEKGIIDIQCATYGKDYKKFIIPAGGCRMPKSAKTLILKQYDKDNMRTLENIHMDGISILNFVSSKVPKEIQSLLKRNSLCVDDIDMFIFHQASKIALDTLMRILKINPKKVFRNFREIGNTVSASIPIAIKDALIQGAISNGDKVLICGFGVGLSCGTALLEL